MLGRPWFIISFIAGVAAASLSAAPCMAGVPRGVTLAADEQIADEATGVTIARGRAEIRSETYAITGKADSIEVRPAINEVLLKGSAQIAIGARQYRSDTLSCTLDFTLCVAVDADQPLPASAAGAALTSPR